MLTFPLLLALTAFVAAITAFMRARRVAKRLERLTESYWELRYEYGQLRARISRLEPSNEIPVDPSARQTGTTAFVPLSSLKR